MQGGARYTGLLELQQLAAACLSEGEAFLVWSTEKGEDGRFRAYLLPATPLATTGPAKREYARGRSGLHWLPAFGSLAAHARCSSRWPRLAVPLPSCSTRLPAGLNPAHANLSMFCCCAGTIQAFPMTVLGGMVDSMVRPVFEPLYKVPRELLSLGVQQHSQLSHGETLNCGELSGTAGVDLFCMPCLVCGGRCHVTA